MPLSDDELLGIEQITIALRDYPEPAHGGVMVSKGIIDHQLGRVPDLIVELRAARKVVGATRTLVDYLPRVVWEEYRRHNEEAYYLDELKAVEAALAEYDAASAEPQEQPA